MNVYACLALSLVEQQQVVIINFRTHETTATNKWLVAIGDRV
jgi:hypothetical protein